MMPKYSAKHLLLHIAVMIILYLFHHFVVLWAGK